MTRTLNVGSQSVFVTTTAWAAIVLAAGVTVLAGLQHAQIASLLPQWQATPLLPVTGWLLRQLPWVVSVAAVLSLLLVAAAVGLLLRLDWARRMFIGLIALVIAANALGAWLQHEVVQAMVLNTLQRVELPAQAAGLFDGLATAAQVMGVVVTLSACALLAWVIRRLMSEPVRQEFA
jgi:hypothetical protein